VYEPTKVKARKFRELMPLLEEHMRNAWDESEKLGPGAKRARQTEIINSAWTKNSNGGWVANPNAPVFREFRTHSIKKTMQTAVGGTHLCV
jgi:hypothetical protein